MLTRRTSTRSGGPSSGRCDCVAIRIALVNTSPIATIHDFIAVAEVYRVLLAFLPLGYVKCQTSHVECRIGFVKRPTDPLTQLGKLVIWSFDSFIRHSTWDV